MDCWICGAPATTGEHKTKQSDLRSLVGAPSQAKPLYYHDNSTKNRAIGSYDQEFLKSASRLCAKCNNQLTQPYDRAWEKLSEALRAQNPAIKPGDSVSINSVFPDGSAGKMLDVQLFFTKLTGCHLMEANIKFDQPSLSLSILRAESNPYIYLKFGTSKDGGLIGMTDMHADTLASDNSCAFAVWCYSLGTLAVHVMYAIKGERRDGLVGAWHPSFGASQLVIADFP